MTDIIYCTDGKKCTHTGCTINNRICENSIENRELESLRQQADIDKDFIEQYRRELATVTKELDEAKEIINALGWRLHNNGVITRQDWVVWTVERISDE